MRPGWLRALPKSHRDDRLWRGAEVSKYAPRFRLLRYTGPIRLASGPSKMTQTGHRQWLNLSRDRSQWGAVVAGAAADDQNRRDACRRDWHFARAGEADQMTIAQRTMRETPRAVNRIDPS
jgi:hypothetical protein